MAREREGKMKGTVKCDLYFRSEPKKEDGNIITYLAKGRVITILEDLGEWLKVKVVNKHGYVMAEYVDIAPEAAEEAETAEESEEKQETAEQAEDPEKEDGKDE